MKQESLIKTILRRIKKRVSAKTLIILIITLSANSFAWFIYANKVQGGVEARVKAWNVTFSLDDGEITEYITIDVDELYPGKSFSKSLTIYNNGDTDADLSFQINSITLFGSTIQYTEAQNANINTLLTNIQSNWPFTLTPVFSSNILEAHDSETFNISINWPYESGNDARDTEWGARAYTYSSQHPGVPSLVIEIKIVATQRNAAS